MITTILDAGCSDDCAFALAVSAIATLAKSMAASESATQKALIFLDMNCFL